MATSTLDTVPHVQAKFFTTQKQYSIPDSSYSLPSSVSSKELNNVIHSILHSGDTYASKVEFDFLINGEFLRSSLEVHLEDKNVSAETVIEIEYIERQAAPRPESSLAHNDWVSCVRGKDSLIVCGCYDNTLQLWTRDGKCLKTISGHSGPVKCVAWVNSGDSVAGGERLFVSGSHDQTLYVWKLNASREVNCLYACKGHAGSIDCVTVHSDGARIVTGSWDKMIKLWSIADDNSLLQEEDDDDEGRKTKKLKSIGHKVATRVPLVTLSGHKEAVSAVTWLDDSNLCTASWDHTLRLWDMSRTVQTQTVEGSKAFFAIAQSLSPNVIVSASADRHVRLHDLRTKEMKGTYTSHTAWVSSLDWSKTNEHLFLSGSHDMIMKLWDTRSPKAPLYNLIGQDDKILAVDWSIPDLMLSGGADNQLKMFNYKKQ